ncbi:unnamed protein product [Amoebophrya sp. A25]|nr:unnamed protein product [Amoebophrya sp. A25]|eukprot:GSA25T00007279001.1
MYSQSPTDMSAVVRGGGLEQAGGSSSSSLRSTAHQERLSRQNSATHESSPVTSSYASLNETNRTNPTTYTAAEEVVEEQDNGACEAVAILGSGSFGIVYSAERAPRGSGNMIAIKKVFQDRRYRNREVQIMEELGRGNHPNIVQLVQSFYTKGSDENHLYLNLMMQYVPDTLYNVANRLKSEDEYGQVPDYYIMIYSYQLLRALGFLKAHSVMHRDIKPQNLLVDERGHPPQNRLKICDFGSAKTVDDKNPSVQYICSRYYRAPELIFGSERYGCPIDIWSAGCVIGELLKEGKPLFPGNSGVLQLVEIIKVLGTPERQELRPILGGPGVKADYFDTFAYKPIKARGLIEKMPWRIRNRSTRTVQQQRALELLEKILRINPEARVEPLGALCDPFFDPIRASRCHQTRKGLVYLQKDFATFSEFELQLMDEGTRKILSRTATKDKAETDSWLGSEKLCYSRGDHARNTNTNGGFHANKNYNNNNNYPNTSSSDGAALTSSIFATSASGVGLSQHTTRPSTRLAGM